VPAVYLPDQGLCRPYTCLTKACAGRQEFGGNLTTALCAVDVPGAGWVSGYQLSAGAAACTVAVDGAAQISTTYACGCMASGEVQGLAPPDASKGETCEAACAQARAGRSPAGALVALRVCVV